jgi:hypothetical protein
MSLLPLLSHVRLPLRLLVFAALALAPQLHAGGVLRVGATRPHKTIQSAVNTARAGDLILVDPGTYPGFLIVNKGIAVVAASTSFVVTTSTTAPAIFVRGMVYPAEVTIIGAQINYASKTQPAVRLLGNTGSVRFSQLFVNEAADICGAKHQAAVVVETTKTFWFLDSRVFTGTARKGSTTIPLGVNDGVSGVFVRDSDGVVQNCQFRGYDACVNYSGDGLRMTGNTSIYIVDDYARSPQATIIQGGTGGKFGGNGLHYLGARSGLNRITMCGRTKLVGGKGSTKNGGFYALNNDGGQPRPGVWRLPKPCSGQQVAQTSSDSPVAAPGGNIRLRIYTLFNRSYSLFVSTNSAYRRNLLGLRLAGRGMVDVTAPLATRLTSGVTTGRRSTVLNLAVPKLPALSGVQLTFQSLMGPVNGVGNTLGFPSLVVITQ